MVLSLWSLMWLTSVCKFLVNALQRTQPKHAEEQFPQNRIESGRVGNRMSESRQAPGGERCEDVLIAHGNDTDPASALTPRALGVCRLYLVDFNLRRVALVENLNKFESLSLLLQGIRDGSLEPPVYHVDKLRRENRR